MRQIEEYYYLKPGAIVSGGGRKTTAEARMVAMYIMRTIYKYSLFEIGEYFERDHSTVIYFCKKAVKYLKTEPDHQISQDIIYFIDKFKRGHTDET